MRSPLLGETDRRLDTQAAAWDAFVEATPGGDLVQTSAWGRSKRAIGLGTRLVVVRDGGGEIAGGALILLKRVAPGLCAGSVARGPLLRDASVDAGSVVDRVLSETRGAGVRFLIAQPPKGAGHSSEHSSRGASRPAARASPPRRRSGCAGRTGSSSTASADRRCCSPSPGGR